jgi:predicted PurR-regulated permease PerM
MARLVSFVALVAILIGIGLLFMQVMWGFMLPLFLAALLGVVFQPLYNWCLTKCHNYRYLIDSALGARSCRHGSYDGYHARAVPC